MRKIFFALMIATASCAASSSATFAQTNNQDMNPGMSGSAAGQDRSMTQGMSGSMMTGDITDAAMAAPQFSTLVRAIQAAGLVETLKGPGPFTVFAPTNEAFAKLPAGTLDMLLMPENRDMLRTILTYHVVAGRVPAPGMMKGSTKAKTVQGEELKVQFNTIMVDKAMVTPTGIMVSNCIIHPIDMVLMPKDAMRMMKMKMKNMNMDGGSRM